MNLEELLTIPEIEKKTACRRFHSAQVDSARKNQGLSFWQSL